jgi:hypothetical protein
VLVWLCAGCLAEMDQLQAERPSRAKRTRKVLA